MNKKELFEKWKYNFLGMFGALVLLNCGKLSQYFRVEDTLYDIAIVFIMSVTLILGYCVFMYFYQKRIMEKERREKLLNDAMEADKLLRRSKVSDNTDYFVKINDSEI